MIRTYQAKLPTSATNLSKSLAPAQLITAQNMTIKKRKIFFCHLTFGLPFPLRENIPFSIMRTAGNSWSGTESKIASEYRNCTACTSLLSELRFVITTVWTSDPKARYARTPAPPNRTT